jgi:hypothetical protein
MEWTSLDESWHSDPTLSPLVCKFSSCCPQRYWRNRVEARRLLSDTFSISPLCVTVQRGSYAHRSNRSIFGPGHSQGRRRLSSVMWKPLRSGGSQKGQERSRDREVRPMSPVLYGLSFILRERECTPTLPFRIVVLISHGL